MFFVDLIIRLEKEETNQMIVTKTYENMGQRHKKFVLPELRIPETDLDETQELPPFRLLPIDALPSQLPPSPSESDYPDPRPTIVPKGPNDLETSLEMSFGIGKQTMPETPVAFLAEELEIRLTQIKKKDG